jgi:cytochrome c5
MNRIVVVLSLVLAVSVVASCDEKKYPIADNSVPARQYTPLELADGKKIYDANCDKCHEFHEPSELTVKKWGKIMPKMCKKAELTKEQSELVTAWVNANARK